MDRLERVLGSIYGAAIGDAMGTATETMTPGMIRLLFGGYVDKLLPAPQGTFLYGCPTGHVSDDFSLAWYTAKGLIGCKGDVTEEVAKEILLNWYADERYARFAGPSTGKAIQRILGNEPEKPATVPLCDNAAATNGAAMKIFPAGLIHPGDSAEAVEDAVTLCMPTHDNGASLSGACAIAAAVSAAVAGADIDKVFEEGFYGAHFGARCGRVVAVASVEDRMELAIAIGKRGGNTEETMLRLGRLVGSGIAANEAVPVVFGILAATGGDAMAAVKMGVNIGNDTDTVATMCGAIAGAMSGADAFPKEMTETIAKVNKMDLEGLAKDLTEVFPA